MQNGNTAYLSLTIKRGETFYKEFTMFQNNNSPLNTSGWVGTWNVRVDVNGDTVLCSPIITVINGSNGKWAFSIPASMSVIMLSTAKILQELERYYYDVKFNTGSTMEYRIEGNLNMKGVVTRS